MSTPTIQELTQAAEQIRLETSNNANTAERVGEALGGIVEYLDDNIPEGLDTELTSLDSRLDTAEGKITTAEGNITTLQALAASGYRIAGFIAPNNSYLAKAVEGTCYFVTNPASASWHDSVVGKVYLPPSTYTPSGSAPSSVTGWTSFDISGACIFGYKNGAWSKHDIPYALVTDMDDMMSLLEITDFTVANYSIGADGKLGSNTTYGHGVLQVNEGEVYFIANNQASTDTVRYVFATEDYRTANGTIPRVGDVGIVPHQTKVKVTIPSGCTYLMWNSRNYQSKIYGLVVAQLQKSVKKSVFISPESEYTRNSITFPQGTSLWYEDASGGTIKQMSFQSATTYIFDTNHTILALRGNELVHTTTTKVGEGDVVLLQWGTGNEQFVSGALYHEYIAKNRKASGIPFIHYLYSGVSSNYIQYSTSAKYLLVELSVDGIESIRNKDGYMIAAIIIGEPIPTEKFVKVTENISVDHTFANVKDAIATISGWKPYKLLIAIRKDDNTAFDDIIGSVDDMVDITYSSTPSMAFNKPRRTVRKFGLVRGVINEVDGLNSVSEVYIDRLHTPKFIRLDDDVKLTLPDTLNFGGRVYYYDENFSMIKWIPLSTTQQSGVVDILKECGVYFRVMFSTNGWDLPTGDIELEGVWYDDSEVFMPTPLDDGYQCLCFPVRVNTCHQPSSESSSINTMYVDSADHGILHLPPSYDPFGAPTPLIIYLHGAAERYTKNSRRFGENVRYSPEWSAMGYAQMDVDMIPELYSFTAANTSGTCDDYDCVLSAYRWVIEHYNIRRDGVYLFGRSRGGMAVLNILSRYNPKEMPIICALSNAGANCALTYGLFNKNVTTAWWNALCKSFGIWDDFNSASPSITLNTNKTIPQQSSLVTFLRDRIDRWWNKAMVFLPLMIENNTQYKTPTQIFDLIMASYSVPSDKGKDYCEWVSACKFRSPVPLRFDWCVGDTIQVWDANTWGNYGSAGKDAFVNSYHVGNAVYREWPTCTEGNEPHYHEKFNLTDGDYTLPNGEVIEDASMAQVEWMNWARQYDHRLLGL